MINISLPDGSVRSFDKPVSGAEIAAVDRPRPRQGSACAARRRQDGGPRLDRRSRRQDRHRDVARSGGARAAAPRRGARAGPGGPGTLSRHADHVRSGDGGRLLLRLRARRAVLAGGLRQDRAAHGRDRRPRPADHARGLGPRQDQGLLQAARRELQGRVGRRAAQGRGDLGLQAGRLARHVPRARTCRRRASSARRSS